MKATPGIRLFASALLLAPFLGRAQSGNHTADDETIVLSAFEVHSTKDEGYRAANAVSTTGIAQELAKTPLPITVVTEGDKYTDVLPSLNLAFEFPHELKWRIGAATTVARPRLDDLGGGSSYTVTSDQATPPNFDGTQYYWTRNGGGNPKLKPWKANSFDMSLEKYLGTRA